MHRHMFCFKRRDAITRKGMVIMKKINRRNFLKVMGLASASLTLAACGGSSSTATSTAASTATSAAASAAAGDAAAAASDPAVSFSVTNTHSGEGVQDMLSALFRGLGDSRSPLIFVLVACIVNIIGDLVLVAGFHLDAAGAAIATVAAQAVSVICAIAMLLKKELPFKIHRSDFKLNPQCKKFLGIGLPLALQEFLTQLSFLALCAFVNRLGLEASSGYGVACKIVNFAMLIPSSLMQSMASFVSQNVGAGNKKRAEQSMFTGIGIGLVFGCVVFALVWCKGDVLSSLFTADASVIANGYAYLKGFAPETIATAILFSMVGYFNGNDKTLWVMVQGLVQTLLVRLPMAYIMSIQPNASLTMIGLSAPTSTVVGILLNIGFFLWLKRYENQTSA